VTKNLIELTDEKKLRNNQQEYNKKKYIQETGQENVVWLVDVKGKIKLLVLLQIAEILKIRFDVDRGSNLPIHCLTNGVFFFFWY
jgi:hypothetical protein